MTKKILITGASGFIARSLYEYFSSAYFSPLEKNILTIGRSELDLLDSGSVYDYLKQNKFDVVIHAATYDAVPTFTNKDPKLVLENNLKMFFNISRAHKHFGKMIYYGSGAEAGRQNWTPKMTEDYIESNIPDDQYGLSKYIMNKFSSKNNNIYNLRLFGVFGKFDDWRYRFISNACCKAVLEMPIVINKNVRFDYLDISDLALITDKFINCDAQRKSYNVCSGKVYDYLTLAKKIKNISGKEVEILVKKEGTKPEYSGTNTELLKQFEDLKITAIDESIKSLYTWYDANKQIIKKELFEY
jgi:GDP-L-fucose synthase